MVWNIFYFFHSVVGDYTTQYIGDYDNQNLLFLVGGLAHFFRSVAIWAPQDSVQLVYNYNLAFGFMVARTIGKWGYKPTYNCRVPHIVGIL